MLNTSRTPSPSNPPLAARTSPENSPNRPAGVVDVGGFAYCPEALGRYSAAAPFAAPETASSPPVEPGGGGGGGDVPIVSVSVAVLLPVFGSATPAGAVIVAWKVSRVPAPA